MIMNSIFKPNTYLILFIALLLCPTYIFAQMSYGGHPLPLDVSSYTRTSISTNVPFIEMEPIDNQSALWRSQQDNEDFKSLEFAHKFYVNISPKNSGVTFTTLDGTKVWRVGLRSSKAYSLNILFSKFNVPEGAQLFVYNADQSEILGSFTHHNNSDVGMLPIQPIEGDEVIVEYQEPANASFNGEVEIGEINHDFMGIFRATEPRDPKQSCHPNIVCYPEDIEAGSGVVAIIINGNTYCTAALINNVDNDGTPYLITASHCINNDYGYNNKQSWKDYGAKGEWHYDKVAGSIVAFFGYQSPNCNSEIRGNVQMTMASLDSVFVSERHDISLLRFKETPPAEYQPYYLGWNATNNSNETPYHGIHHPNGGIKKVAVEEDRLAIGSFGTAPPYNMEPQAHWAVRAWDVAATEGGSSGSPLLDNKKRIVGTLTGGESHCSGPKGPDLYASLNKVWEYTDTIITINPLKSILDPNNTGTLTIDGHNPYSNNPFTKSANLLVNDEITQSYHNSVPLFATNNTYGYKEFAEEFYSKDNKKLQGVFITSPKTSDAQNLNIRIKIYNDNNGAPGTLIHEQKLNYSFKYYEDGIIGEASRNMNNNVENYLRFNNPVSITGKFYVSYSDNSQATDGFSVMNVLPRKRGSIYPNTTWIKTSTEWLKASEMIESPINTSLMIAPYVIGDGLDPNPNTKPSKTETKAFYDKESKRIFIESNRDIISWKLYNASGRIVMEGTSDGSINRITLPLIIPQTGVYLVKVEAEGKRETIKVLVR